MHKKILLSFAVVGLMAMQELHASDTKPASIVDCQRVIRIAVLCGAYNNLAIDLKVAAYQLGQYLGLHHFGLITGGGASGLMKEVTDGYVSQAIALKDFWNIILQKHASDCHSRIASENIIMVQSLYERIDSFYEMADICIALPGGFGTLHELINCLVHEKNKNKPLILLNIDGYWDTIIQQFQKIVSCNPAASKHLELFIVVDTLDACIEILEAARTEASQR
jgi:uncharacterized protein (TIGR00730 family)